MSDEGQRAFAGLPAEVVMGLAVPAPMIDRFGIAATGRGEVLRVSFVETVGGSVPVLRAVVSLTVENAMALQLLLARTLAELAAHRAASGE